MNFDATEVLANLALVGLAFYTICWCYGALKDHMYAKKLAKATSTLEQSPVRFYFNIQNNVIAVCTATSYRDLASFKREMEKPWLLAIRYVSEIFTFALKDERKLGVHTGKMTDLEGCLSAVIYKLTGLSKEDLKPEDFRELCQIVMLRDYMLYVPYASGEKQMEEDYRIFPVYSLNEAKEAITC